MSDPHYGIGFEKQQPVVPLVESSANRTKSMIEYVLAVGLFSSAIAYGTHYLTANNHLNERPVISKSSVMPSPTIDIIVGRESTSTAHRR